MVATFTENGVEYSAEFRRAIDRFTPYWLTWAVGTTRTFDMRQKVQREQMMGHLLLDAQKGVEWRLVMYRDDCATIERIK